LRDEEEEDGAEECDKVDEKKPPQEDKVRQYSSAKYSC